MKLVRVQSGLLWLQKPVCLAHAQGFIRVQNSLAAISVGFQLGLSADEIQAGLSNVSLSPMRQEVTRPRNLTIINDAYNASVKSMKAALDLLSEIGDGRKVAILGDMLEMGEYAPQAHFECR